MKTYNSPEINITLFQTDESITTASISIDIPEDKLDNNNGQIDLPENGSNNFN